MAFTVKYNIMQRGKDAPCYSTSDRQLAYAELSDRQRKGKPLDYWMTWDITPYDLTKPEEYMWFVWQIRQAQKKYWREGKDPVDLQRSLELEEELDRWNTETRNKMSMLAALGKPYLPTTKESTEQFQFFITVEEWCNDLKKWSAAKNNGDHEASARYYQSCRAYETRIETYCKMQMKL